MNQREEFWAAWKALQEEIREAKGHGCVPPVHSHAASAAWEQSANMTLRIPAPWEEAQALVEEGRRHLRYR